MYTGFLGASSGTADVVQSAQRMDANVIFWSFLQMEECTIKETLYQQYAPTCANIAAVAAKLPDALHIISVGGWDYGHPYPDSGCTAQQYADAFEAWACNCANTPGFPGISGIDMDWEGISDATPGPGFTNEWSPETVQYTAAIFNLIGDKGYKKVIIPPESYLDPADSTFTLTLDNSDRWHPDFPYHGRNLYAAFWQLIDPDLVMIQVYEGYCRTTCEAYSKSASDTFADWPKNYPKNPSNTNLIEPAGTDANGNELPERIDKVLHDLIKKYTGGFEIDFGQVLSTLSDDRVTGKQTLKIPGDRLIIGFGNQYTLSNYRGSPCWGGKCVDEYKNVWVRGKGVASTVCCGGTRGAVYWAAMHDAMITGGQNPEIDNWLENIKSGVEACDSQEMQDYCKKLDEMSIEYYCSEPARRLNPAMFIF